MLEENRLETTLQRSPAELRPVYGRGRTNLIRIRQEQSPGQINKRIHVENMTISLQQEARQAEDETPDVITVVDRNGKTD